MNRTTTAGAALALFLSVVAALVVGAPTAAAATTQGVACASEPTYDASVPTPQSVLGFPLGMGQARVVTSEESDRYLLAVDAASDRVESDVLATSWGGKPLRYAVVTRSDRFDANRLESIVRRIQRLRDPSSTESQNATEVAETTPAIVWLAGNVHGGEKSGTDAQLRVLYELAARTDCEVTEILDDLVVAINPTQNPDGRELSRRQNLYGFDMNRDWFARTQPETQGKVDLLRKLPPQVYVDAHEMGGRQYFFPPNADPIHHEVANEVVGWINSIGEANKAAFGWNGQCRAGVTTDCFFNYDVYDLFFMGYGDSAPATGFGAAGMTYEKGSSSPTENRVDQQFRTNWATVKWASENKVKVMNEYAGLWQQAVEEGRAGVLQPNEVLEPQNSVIWQVPDVRVRSYFFPPSRAIGDVRKLVDRLRGMDVEVYKLSKPLTIPNARIFGGRSANDLTVPAGTYWVPMAQAQKHWIQATLGEDPYVPFRYFYDASTWSIPLLMGIDSL